MYQGTPTSSFGAQGPNLHFGGHLCSKLYFDAFEAFWKCLVGAHPYVLGDLHILFGVPENSWEI